MRLVKLLFAGFCWLAGFGAFGTVFGTGLTAFIDPEGIERAADDVVTDTWKVFHPAAANEDDGVFLEVVAFAADVGDDFETVGEADFGDFPKRGVGLFRRAGHDLQANAAALWTVHECGGLRLLGRSVASFANELIDGRHD